MPRRATLTYTSEDARARGLAVGGGGNEPSGKLRVYYCRATGAAALATDADLSTLPTRRTDGASILDTSACTLRLYAQPESAPVLLTRRRYGAGGAADSTTEVQARLAVGGVPVAYSIPSPGSTTSTTASKFLYILPDALSPHLPGTGGDGGEEEGGGGADAALPPPPPVALKLRGGGCQLAVRLVFEERESQGDTASISGVSAERVSVTVPASLRTHEPGLRAAVAAAVAGALDVRRSAVAVQAGPDAESRVVLVTGVGPPEAFEGCVKAARVV